VTRVCSTRQLVPVISSEARELSRLSPTQRAVLADVRTRAAELSRRAYPELLARAEERGFTETELQRVLRYVRDRAPLTINLDLNDQLYRSEALVVDGLIDSGRYLNRFETLGFHSGRDESEANFLGMSPQGARLASSERLKYGALNASHSPQGGATGYGRSHLRLNPGIRPRLTFSPEDSLSTAKETIGTADHFAHVLLNANDDRFMEAMNHGSGRCGPKVIAPRLYIELQIHGPVELARDVEALVANHSYRGTSVELKARELAGRYGIRLEWTDGNAVVGDRN
jgi:hypothetical protein